ncbi:AhpC/TSA family protein [Pedobacter sp. HDW13]|uniref:TlpA disulfide reductase family protein n=1 Tax=unclassified Pedobacter TaxID=2628915 RepID=UPI000F5A7C6A|nr:MULTISPECIES: TlpA disulfide reductase family protein [unclassified Pedobacter]QIL37948.1 AhpC/TSA family protein [Pedobacter sp. HDW13]RQO68947.1 thioredoxin [Pedobacter sp. KBW01]
MKNLLLYSLAAFLSLPGFAQEGTAPNFRIKGKISGKKTGYVYLSYPEGEGQKTDSAVIRDGAFVFKGKLAEPVMANIAAFKGLRNMDDPNVAAIFIEPGVMDMSMNEGAFKKLVLKGSHSNDELEDLNSRKAPIRKEMEPLEAAYRNEKDYEKAPIAYQKLEPFKARMNKIDLAFISAHPDSYVSAYLMRSKMSLLKLEEATTIYNSWTERIRTSASGKYVNKEIVELKSGSPGSTAKVFSSTDINGEQFNLSDFRGKKYVLVDFWASWCLPCRKGNPYLLSLYNKYKDKGLEIVGVAFDDGNSAGWKKAVEKDQIGVWKHVLSGLSVSEGSSNNSNAVSKGYGIHSLPTKVLIDKEGVIIGRYGLGGENDEAMDKKLAEIFVNTL